MFHADQETNRIGGPICYYSDVRGMKAHYPGRDNTKLPEEAIGEIFGAWQSRLGN